MNAFESRMDGMEEKLHNVATRGISSSPEIITKEIEDLKSLLAVLPRNVRLEKRLLLFPEHARSIIQLHYDGCFILLYQPWLLDYTVCDTFYL